MEKTYDPNTIEQYWYDNWEKQDYFAPSGEGESYCIMIPPPNVTGTLHMGHAFQDTIMDALIRYQRMRGRNTLWQPGTDHAGIATQMVVERQLNQAGQSRHDLGREKFIERVWGWKQHSGGTITQQLRRMGASLDWAHERFTMDDGLSNAVKEVFVQLYDEGLIYRGKRLVNWDPVLKTAVSDLEVVSEEEQGSLWHIRYPLADGDSVDGRNYVVVATTRPETMLGDTAVAVHPEDERFQHLIGKQVMLPLMQRPIPIIADDYVEREFGTGCLKITPAHDFNDYAVGQRHDLPIINIFSEDATLNDNTPAAYQGLDRFEARRRIVADLEAQGLLEKVQPHTLKVPRGDRTGQVIEPYLTDQWFVDLTCETLQDGRPGGKTLITEPAIKAVEDGQIQFIPGNWDKTYFEWMRNIEDWCISRQLWWGHRIPAWYDQDGTIYVGRSETEVREKYQLGERRLRQDDDVLDTWFSSALWPFSTLGWPQQNARLSTFYPGSVLVTGFDIIFFWVARMIMMGLKFMDGVVPFHEIYIHGLVRDHDGQKMSKSKGNVLDPLDIIDGIELEDLIQKRTTGLMQPQMAPRIEQATRKEFPDGIKPHGADALRFTFCSLATTGRDVTFDMGRVEGYRNFCNKIWNAARYVLMNTQEHDCGQAGGDIELSIEDRWIISRLQQTEQAVNDAIRGYRFDQAAQALHEFTWDAYCDWYIELSKPVLNGNASEAAKRGTRQTLVRVLETLLRLLHPFMPFISEEIWQQIAPLAGKRTGSISVQPYPQADSTKLDTTAEAEIAWLQQFLLGVRRIRAEMNIAPGKLLPVVLNQGNDEDRARATRSHDYLQRLGRLESIEWLALDATEPEAAIALVGGLRILIPLAGLIDPQAERVRLSKEIEKQEKDLARGESKLSNTKFVSKAPPEVVAKERERVAAVGIALQQLREQYERLGRL